MNNDYKFMQDVLGDRLVVTQNMRVTRVSKASTPKKGVSRLQELKRALELKFARQA